MQVPCHCQHVPWHLGANAKSFFAQLIEDPTHHILNEPALGGYQLLLSKMQGTQALIHYIERFTIQLVEYKALNLVDMCSSPMVEIILYDVIINKLYTKSQLSIILLSRHLGATSDIYKGENLQNSLFGEDQVDPVFATIMIRCHQIIMTRRQ